MIKLSRNKILQKIFYWLSALSILIAIPLVTIFILRLGTIFNPLGIFIKVFIYLFCGAVTTVGFIAIILFFYETLTLKFTKKSNKK